MGKAPTASKQGSTTANNSKKNNQAAAAPYPSPIPGLSPKKTKKMTSDTSQKTENDNKGSHVFHVYRTKNLVYELVGLNHSKNKHDDGYWPYTTGLARKGDGIYKGSKENSTSVQDDSLISINVIDTLLRRGPANSVMENESVSFYSTSLCPLLWMLQWSSSGEQKVHMYLWRIETCIPFTNLPDISNVCDSFCTIGTEAKGGIVSVVSSCPRAIYSWITHPRFTLAIQERNEVFTN